MSVTDALKQKVAAVAQTAKIADLQRDVVDQSRGALTTDLGVKVADHDNWCVRRAHSPVSGDR